jgi:RNA polymerase sigma-70 factor (ECF subfamily)
MSTCAPTRPTTASAPPRRKPMSTAELATGLAANEPAAASTLYRDYAKLVYSVAHQRLGRADLAEDATQETMLRAWRAADRIDHDRPIAPWLVTIARRVAIDIGRREQRRATVPLQDSYEVPNARDEAARTDTALTVQAALRRLEDGTAELARLHHYEGLTYAEVAERVNIPIGTVKSRCFRMHNQLQSILLDEAS